MPKFNVHTDYFDHPKVQRLKLYCGEEADIFPIRLWAFCAKHFPETGVLKNYTELEVEKVLGWNGVQGNLIRALVSLQFLDKKGAFFCVHDWKEHAGFIKAYRIKGKQMAEARWSKHAASIAVCNTKEKNRKEKNKDIPLPPFGGLVIPEDLKANEKEIADWLEYKAQKKQPYKAKGLEALWRSFRAIHPTKRREAVDYSMSNNWSGLFEKKSDMSLPQKSAPLKNLSEVS